MRSSSRSYLPGILLLSAASALMSATPRQAQAAAPTSTVVSTPQIQVALDPYTADNKQRIYQLANGGTYWTPGMPIYQGDKVHVAVFVATGANDLQQLRVKIDNRPVADLTSSPWSAEFDSTTLGPGPHALEAWAQVSGPKPQFISRTLSFFVQQDPKASVPLPQVSEPAAASISDATPGNTASGITVKVKAFVGSIGSTPPVADADVHILPQTVGKSDIPVEEGQAVVVTGPIVIHVVPAANSQAVKFTYAITRYGNQIVAPDTPLEIDSFDVRVQPRTNSTPGLLAGTATVEVWGFDRAGRHGVPQTLTLDIEPQAGS